MPTPTRLSFTLVVVIAFAGGEVLHAAAPGAGLLRTQGHDAAESALTSQSFVEVEQSVAGIPMLSPEKCATLANAPPVEAILEKERCSVCEIIVENARKWNWVGHYSSLCEGIPPHALEWVSLARFAALVPAHWLHDKN